MKKALVATAVFHLGLTQNLLINGDLHDLALTSDWSILNSLPGWNTV